MQMKVLNAFDLLTNSVDRFLGSTYPIYLLFAIYKLNAVLLISLYLTLFTAAFVNIVIT